MDEQARVFTTHRSTLVGVAYRILGSVSDAEDVVQEAWLRWADRPMAEIVNPRAFLIRVTSRLALDRLRRLKARRESYVGPWLPEPVATEPDAAQEVERAEQVSMALLVVLETLSPLERAVFVLREAFALPYGEIATALDRSEAAVRQLARRARAHVDERRPRYDTDVAARRTITERFLTACRTADLAALMELLAADVMLVGDTGGQARGPKRPVAGAVKVAKVLTSGSYPDTAFELTELNDGPGILVSSAGQLIAAVVLDVRDGLIWRINAVSNPDKLTGVTA